jgi:hypothetical protein
MHSPPVFKVKAMKGVIRKHSSSTHQVIYSEADQKSSEDLFFKSGKFFAGHSRLSIGTMTSIGLFILLIQLTRHGIAITLSINSLR